jgi:hypothetical protein
MAVEHQHPKEGVEERGNLPALPCPHGPPALSCFHGPACTASFVQVSQPKSRGTLSRPGVHCRFRLVRAPPLSPRMQAAVQMSKKRASCAGERRCRRPVQGRVDAGGRCTRRGSDDAVVDARGLSMRRSICLQLQALGVVGEARARACTHTHTNTHTNTLRMATCRIYDTLHCFKPFIILCPTGHHLLSQTIANCKHTRGAQRPRRK